MKLKIFIICILFTCQFFGQKIDTRLNGLKEEIETLIKKYSAVGLSIAVVENNQLLYSKGFGYRDYANKLPVTPNTVFPIGSVTKQFTSSLIGIYEGQGKLSVTDKPNMHLKNLLFYSSEMNSIVTIEDLLSHKSGIGVVDGTHVFFPTNNINAHLERLPYLKPNSKVREQFDYSNMGYAILGAIGEQITKKTWEENIKIELFEPMDMNESSTNLKTLQQNKNFSYGYSVTEGEVLKVLYEDQHESVASGAINSSANDMAKWMKMLLNGGVYNKQQILPKKYLESAFSEHNIIRTSFSFDKKYNLLFDTYGYGWFVHNYKGFYRVNHGGNVSGFSSNLTLYPHKKIGILILTNQDKTNLQNVIATIVSNRMLELPRKKITEYDVRNIEAIKINSKEKTLNSNVALKDSFQKYCGEYQNKGYGTLQIIKEGKNLIVKFPAFRMLLKHKENNVFESKHIVQTHQNVPTFIFEFVEDTSKIINLKIGMQAEAVVFEKISY